MSNLNRVFLMGRLTRDVELTFTPRGIPVASLGVATSRVWKNEAGQKEEETTFIDVTVWGRTAEVVSQYLGKGSSVFVDGRLQLDTWDDKQSGQKRSRLKVVGENVQFLDRRDGTEAVPSAAAPVSPPHPSVLPRSSERSQPAPGAKTTSLDLDDIPF
jgi:single-strand DNA-binding protein